MGTERRTAIIYTRLSRNRSGEQSESTKRQAAACRKLAADEGYEVLRVETDDDVSAYSGKRRPGYERVLEALRTGEASVVLAWSPDRLHRSPRELEDFVDLIEQANATVVTVQAGEIDLETPAGRLQARMLGSIARYESEHRAARTLAAKEQHAMEGRFSGGKKIYGYRSENGKLYVVPAEAEIVREMARRVIAGERPGTIAKDLNRRGVPTTTDRRWTTPTVRGILGNGTVAGRRIYRGEDVGEAEWEAILDPDTVRRVRAVLAAGPRRGRAPRVALFTGDRIICGRCGGRMTTLRRESGRRAYRCLNDFMTVSAEPLEALVVEAIAATLDVSDVPAADEDDGAQNLVDALEADLEALAADLGSGLISRSEWLAAREPLTARLKEARRLAERTRPDTALTGINSAADLLLSWPTVDIEAQRQLLATLEDPENRPVFNLDKQQAIVDALIERVVINPTDKRGRSFDPERVDIEWRDR